MADHPSQELARLIVEVADRAYLTTMANDGYPRTRAVLNLRNPSLYPDQADLFDRHRQDFLVYISTNTSSAKVAQILRDPRGSLYYCHPKRYRGVLLVGDLAVIDDSALRHALWHESWTMYYPGGPDDPDHTVLRLSPRHVEGWNGSSRFDFTPAPA
jgi:general stress protein 26